MSKRVFSYRKSMQCNYRTRPAIKYHLMYIKRGGVPKATFPVLVNKEKGRRGRGNERARERKRERERETEREREREPNGALTERIQRWSKCLWMSFLPHAEMVAGFLQFHNLLHRKKNKSSRICWHRCFLNWPNFIFKSLCKFL